MVCDVQIAILFTLWCKLQACLQVRAPGVGKMCKHRNVHSLPFLTIVEGKNAVSSLVKVKQQGFGRKIQLTS